MLCKEETLVGNSRITLELRPLAFSMLAELVHHVRSELSLSQLSRIIYLFCRSVCCPPVWPVKAATLPSQAGGSQCAKARS